MRRAKVLALLLLLVGMASLSYIIIMSCSDTESPIQSVKPQLSEPQLLEAGVLAIVPGKDDKPTATLSNNSFTGWQRYPAEEKRWLDMANATAYVRDVMVGGETYVSSPVDGETWSASATRPDGSTITWGDITFYAEYNGYQNCFVSQFWYIPNTTSLYILWYTTSQCRETGDWTMRFYNDDVLFYEGTFKVLPQIPPGKVPCDSTYDQLRYDSEVLHHYDSSCHRASGSGYTVCDSVVNTELATIAERGCWLTGACMILGYHGLKVDPPTLNTWLKEHNGYSGENVLGAYVALYAQLQQVDVFYVGHRTGSLIDSYVCSRGPQLAYVRKPTRSSNHHFVTVVGQNEEKTTYLICDPAGGVEIELDDKYVNTIDTIRVFEGDEYQYKDDLSHICVCFHSPGELLITDPEGRQTGVDPLSGQSFEEIPNAAYFREYIEDIDDNGGPESKLLEINRPDNGDYKLVVTGTDEGTFDLDFLCFDAAAGSFPSRWTTEDNPITEGAVFAYTIGFDKTPGAQLVLTGGYPGTRQRPTDVNKFLSYVTITTDVTNLPPGTESFALHLNYGPDVYPETFGATLNGADVTGLFDPAAGGYEVVNLTLTGGLNTLELSIDGQTPDRVMTDTDILEFVVE